MHTCPRGSGREDLRRAGLQPSKSGGCFFNPGGAIISLGVYGYHKFDNGFIERLILAR